MLFFSIGGAVTSTTAGSAFENSKEAVQELKAQLKTSQEIFICISFFSGISFLLSLLTLCNKKNAKNHYEVREKFEEAEKNTKKAKEKIDRETNLTKAERNVSKNAKLDELDEASKGKTVQEDVFTIVKEAPETVVSKKEKWPDCYVPYTDFANIGFARTPDEQTLKQSNSSDDDKQEKWMECDVPFGSQDSVETQRGLENLAVVKDGEMTGERNIDEEIVARKI